MRPGPMRLVTLLLGAAAAALSGSARAQTMTADQFRSQLVGVPLCGTPASGTLAGKPLCTVHQPDGSAVLAGSGVFIRGIWDMDGNRVCRRSATDPLDRRRCVEYERVGQNRFRNSDG